SADPSKDPVSPASRSSIDRLTRQAPSRNPKVSATSITRFSRGLRRFCTRAGPAGPAAISAQRRPGPPRVPAGRARRVNSGRARYVVRGCISHITGKRRFSPGMRANGGTGLTAGGPAADGLTGSVVTAVREALRPAPVSIRRAADPVGMGVVTDDPAAAAPIIMQLRARPQLGVRHVLPPHRGDVTLALATHLSGGMLAELTSLAGQAGHPARCVVLVAD